MPNWCNNTLRVYGEKAAIKRFLKQVKNDKGEFTFEKTVPRPPELDITSGSNVDNAVDVMAAEAGKWDGVDQKLEWPVWVQNAGIITGMPIKKQRELMLANMKKNLSEKDMQEGRQSIENKKKYGCKNWYEWNCANWGTKWDAGESDICDMGEDVEIRFDTAWAPPIEWLKTTELKFPDLNFELHYDEPGMAFKGVYSNGKDKCINY